MYTRRLWAVTFATNTKLTLELSVLYTFSHIDLANASFTFDFEDADKLTQFQIW